MSFELRMSDFDAEQIAYQMGLDPTDDKIREIINLINWTEVKSKARDCVEDYFLQFIAQRIPADESC